MSQSYSWNDKLSTCTVSLRDAHCMHSTYTVSFMNTQYSWHDCDLYTPSLKQTKHVLINIIYTVSVRESNH